MKSDHTTGQSYTYISARRPVQKKSFTVGDLGTLIGRVLYYHVLPPVLVGCLIAAAVFLLVYV